MAHIERQQLPGSSCFIVSQETLIHSLDLIPTSLMDAVGDLLEKSPYSLHWHRETTSTDPEHIVQDVMIPIPDVHSAFRVPHLHIQAITPSCDVLPAVRFTVDSIEACDKKRELLAGPIPVSLEMSSQERLDLIEEILRSCVDMDMFCVRKGESHVVLMFASIGDIYKPRVIYESDLPRITKSFEDMRGQEYILASLPVYGIVFTLDPQASVIAGKVDFLIHASDINNFRLFSNGF